MRRRLFKYSSADGLLTVLIIAMVCASVRLEDVIDKVRDEANSLADEQELLAPPSATGLSICAMGPRFGDLRFRFLSSRTTSLWCFEGDEEVCKLAQFPAGEHVLAIRSADYSGGNPRSVQVTRFTGGEEKQVVNWSYPDGLKCYEMHRHDHKLLLANVNKSAELCIKKCGTRDFRIVLKLDSWGD